MSACERSLDTEDTMDIAGKIVVVTGAARGIGRALAEGAKARGAKTVVAVDLDEAHVQETARRVEGRAMRCDVSNEADIARVIETTEREIGPIDLFCSNAGIGGFRGDANNCASGSTDSWNRAWAINVMAHVHAARLLLPRMIPRGGGYFLNTVSAAGVLNQVGGAVYGTTKHAAIGFAENLAFSHRDQGIRVSVLCPQGVDTDMLRASGSGPQFDDGVITAEACATAALDGVQRETFCILPHPVVLDYMQRKAADYDRWIGGMAKLNRAYQASRAG
jgi:NAD(P)-dependent dehydrogenase (short-subunit alcohol dehydrogenase family)